jgi:hypothetical protein
MLGADEKCDNVYKLKKQLDRMELDQVSQLFIASYLEEDFIHFAILQIGQAWDIRSFISKNSEDCKVEVIEKILTKLDKV